MKNSKVQFVAFLDSDDYFLPNSLGNIERLIKENPNPDLIIAKWKSSYNYFDSEILYKKSNSKKYSSNKFLKFINKIDWTNGNLALHN